MNIDNYEIFGVIDFACAHDWDWCDGHPVDGQISSEQNHWFCLFCGEQDYERAEPDYYDYGEYMNYYN